MRATVHARSGEDLAVRRVAQALQGPVTDILRAAIPQLQDFGRKDAYERIMNSPELASRCVEEFRSRPELFRRLMVGPDRRPVQEDTALLSCGRTLAQVIALIVRAVARRHFRRRLGGHSPGIAAGRQEGALRRMMRRLLRRPPPPTARRGSGKRSRAEVLYQELRDFLVFEWQLPLIPHYVDLPIPLLKALGPDILHYRDADGLRELARNGLPAGATEADGAADAGAAGTAEPASALSGDRAEPGAALPAAAPAPAPAAPANPAARAEAMWVVAQSLELCGLFRCDERELRRTIAHASAAGPALEALVGSGIRPREAVVILCAFARKAGDAHMARLLGNQANRRFLAAFVAALRDQGVASMRLPANVKEATEVALARLKVPVLDAAAPAGSPAA